MADNDQRQLIKFNITVFALVLFLFSSCNPFDLEPLDVKTVKNIQDHRKMVSYTRWFHTSDIPSVHNHVEINSNRGWMQVLEADGNRYKIYDIFGQSTTLYGSTKGEKLLALVKQ